MCQSVYPLIERPLEPPALQCQLPPTTRPARIDGPAVRRFLALASSRQLPERVSRFQNAQPVVWLHASQHESIVCVASPREGGSNGSVSPW